MTFHAALLRRSRVGCPSTPPRRAAPAMAGLTKVMRSTTAQPMEHTSSAVAPWIRLRASAYGAYLFGSCSGDPAARFGLWSIPLRQLLQGSCWPPRSEDYSSSAVASGILPRFGSVSIRLRGLRRNGVRLMSNASVWPFPLALNRVVRNQLWERIQALRPVASLRRRRVMCMR